MNYFRIDMKGDELHKNLGGGLPTSAFVLIEAPNAVGKSILAQRFVYGVLHNGHTATYISTELGLSGFLKQMLSLRYDIRTPLLTKQLKFISLYPAFGQVHFRENMIELLLGSEQLFASQIIVIDTISELLVRTDLDLQACFSLIHRLRRVVGQEKTIIMCVDPTTLNGKLLDLLRSVSDVYIKMEVREQYGNIIKVLKVERFNSAPGEVSNEIPFKVKAGLGIVPELATTS